MRPKVLIRKNGSRKRRQRFTMAHELGHVIPAWHVGQMVCSPVRTAFDATATGQEAEANRFASALLVPRRFLEERARQQIGDVVSALDVAEVSASAAILALARNLLPGFCFLIDEDEDGFRAINSSGTKVPGGSGRGPEIARLRDKAYEFGEAVVSGRRVLWFQFATQSDFFLPEDDRDTRDILRDALAFVAVSSEVPKLILSINGIVGGMLSKGDRAHSTITALAVLEHRFDSDQALQHLMEIPDFQLYLRRKVVARVGHR
ncbi:MAG: ImmA/IrrE family metallo-endopeptidase [Trebonia sp.]